MTTINNNLVTNNLSEDPAPKRFLLLGTKVAILQISKAASCKTVALEYMEQIKESQARAKECSEIIELANSIRVTDPEAKGDDEFTVIDEKLIQYLRDNGIEVQPYNDPDAIAKNDAKKGYTGDDAEANVRKDLMNSLKEIYYTDGDGNFISPDGKVICSIESVEKALVDGDMDRYETLVNSLVVNMNYSNVVGYASEEEFLKLNPDGAGNLNIFREYMKCGEKFNVLKLVRETGPYDSNFPDNKWDYAEWDVTIKSLTNFQEQLTTSVQTNMVMMQDFMGQYNSYTQGANKSCTDTAAFLTAMLTT